ncbi:uncharacterized protein [Dysidea avara]|uniref:uncharacterized protein isoform X1 n=1 Tax=Dysidea avara TaxID=196820 RepID=UPI00332E9EA4
MSSIPDSNNRWIGHYKDHFSKFSILWAQSRKCAAETVLCLQRYVFAYLGVPKILQSDHGREFNNELFETIVHEWSQETILIRGRPRHPQSNGCVEKANGVVKHMLTSLMADMKTTEWVQFLPRVQFTINKQPHATIKTSPYQVVFGLDPSSEPVKGMCLAEEETIIMDPPTETDDLTELGNTDSYSDPVTKATQPEVAKARTCVGDTEFRQQTPIIPAENEDRHHEVRQFAKKNIANSAAKMKKLYDNSKRIKAVKFKIGDGVTVRIPRHDRGVGDLRRIPGVVVAKQHGSYKIKTEYGLLKGRCRTDQLQKCFHATVQTTGWEDDPTIALRSAAKKFNRRKTDVSHCNCKSGCVNGKCVCFKSKVKCTTYCHKGTRCKNSVIADDSSIDDSCPLNTETGEQANENRTGSTSVKTKQIGSDSFPVKREQVDLEPSYSNARDGCSSGVQGVEEEASSMSVEETSPKLEGGHEIFSNEDIPPGNSFQFDKIVKLSKKMKTIIQNHPSFLFKPCGPAHEYISNSLKTNLPAAFLHSYVVDNYEDQKCLKDLCYAHKEPVPITIVQKFTNKMYDLKDDVETNKQTADLLNQEEPTMANVLIDYFHLHKSRGVVHQYCPNSSDEEVDENDYQTEGRLMRIRNKTQMLFEAKFGSYKVYDEGILSLIDTNGWVTDEVIASYLLYMIRANKKEEEIFIMNVSAVNDICNGTYILKKKVLSNVDLSHYNALIGPYCYQKMHWILVIVEPKNGKVLYIDPKKYEERDHRLI